MPPRKKALAELNEEMPEYASIEVNWIEESRQAELANQYDYYYVPTIYSGERKLYEADPSENYAAIKMNIKAALDAVLRS